MGDHGPKRSATVGENTGHKAERPHEVQPDHRKRGEEQQAEKSSRSTEAGPADSTGQARGSEPATAGRQWESTPTPHRTGARRGESRVRASTYFKALLRREGRRQPTRSEGRVWRELTRWPMADS